MSNDGTMYAMHLVSTPLMSAPTQEDQHFLLTF